MSWRQPAAMRRESMAETRANRSLAIAARNMRLVHRASVRNFGHLSGLERLEKFAGPGVIEQRIRGFDAQEKPVAAGLHKTRHIECRVVRHRQTAQREQDQDRGDRRNQNRQLERDYDIRRPAMQRPSGDVERVFDDGDVILEQISAQPAQDSADQHNQRQLVVMEVQRLAQLLDGKRRVGIELAIAFFMRRARRTDQRRGIVEFGQHTVYRFVHPCPSSSILAWGSRVRTSKIEIMGSRRMNRKNRNRKSPMVPRYVPQSQRVPWKRPHEDGTKSCARLLTIIT